jgi:response regulator RpfG family c-di-GMP phosphodiesterase
MRAIANGAVNTDAGSAVARDETPRPQAVLKPRVICVDDDVHIVQATADALRKDCSVLVAYDGIQALALLETEPDIELIMSDMRMPGMDGVTLLAHARALKPDVPRVLLTGEADMESAIAAVNDGQVFRFLTKPCGRQQLRDAVAAAITHHRLITSEHVLLEQTLHGSIGALVDILAMSNPASFGRANRIKARVRELAVILELLPRWQVETAALLQPIGYVALPPEVLDKLRAGHLLSADQRRMVERLPAVTEQLLAHIPRLEEVRAILTRASCPSSGGDTVVELGAAILRLAGELDDLETRGTSLADAVDIVRGRGTSYPPRVLDAATALVGAGRHTRIEIHEVTLARLRTGMVLAEDVKLANGALLVARGYEVTVGFIERVRNFPQGALQARFRIAVALDA